MSVVSIAEAWPAPGKPFTVAELDRMPDDGHRYELPDGALVGSYWVVIPDRDKPELIVFELHAGRYEEAARVSGDEPFAAVRPFRIEVIPARLVAGLQPG